MIFIDIKYMNASRLGKNLETELKNVDNNHKSSSFTQLQYIE